MNTNTHRGICNYQIVQNNYFWALYNQELVNRKSLVETDWHEHPKETFTHVKILISRGLMSPCFTCDTCYCIRNLKKVCQCLVHAIQILLTKIQV
jgi:hypothetical protein